MMEILNEGYKHKGDPVWYLSIMPRRHARHEECIEMKFHIFCISVTGTLRVELLDWGCRHSSTEERSHNAWWNRCWVGPNNSLDFMINNPSPAGKCTKNINPTANNLLTGKFQFINLYTTRQFLTWFSSSVGFLKTTNLHYRNMCSCQWNQLSAQYSQYFSSILFITSTCFGPLQVHHQEE